MDILTAIRSRASTRAFLEDSVEPTVIQSILEAARFAPSGKNSQPWQVAVLTGEKKMALSNAIITARKNDLPANPDYSYYAKEQKEPYISRQKACGIALYKALGIKREDTDRRQQVWENNYYFFHAPVGLIFYMDRTLEKGSFLDMGMFIQNVMLAAMEFGLATCPQAALAEYPDIVRKELEISENFQIICGMSLGYPDKTKTVNQYRTERATVPEFTRWYGESISPQKPKQQKIAVLVAMEEELEPLLEGMNIIERTVLEDAPLVKAEFKGTQILFLVCGIGKVNGSIGTHLLYHHYQPELIINIGTAAGIQSHLKTGDLVIGAEISHHDVDVTAFNYVTGQVPGMPPRYALSEKLKELTDVLTRPHSHIKHGLVLSGDSFLSSSEKIELIKQHFPDALAIDMEAAAIAQTCHRLKQPLLVIRSISDSGDESAKDSHANNIRGAQQTAANLLKNIVLKKISG